MSIKLERDVVRQASGPGGLPVPVPSPLANNALPSVAAAVAGTAALGALKTGAAPAAANTPNGYLAAYIQLLEDNPLRTKILTAGVLAGLQELIASWLAKDFNKHGHYFTPRVPKMAAYGALVSAPLGHFFIWCLQRTFRHKTSFRSKIMQILASNLIVAPIQNVIYLVAMALIAGARTGTQVRATVRVGFWKVMRVSWITSPIGLAFAQQFLPDHLWVPFFNLIAFVIGTYINTTTKKKRLAALRSKHFGHPRASTSSRPPPSAVEEEYTKDYAPSAAGPKSTFV